jgi:hypothetical protein
MLETDIKQGISSHEVETRRKRYGWNEITTEKENLFIKFLGFFTGPVLYGKSYPRLWHRMQAFIVALAQWLRGDVCFAFASFVATRSYGQPTPPPRLPRHRRNLHVHDANYAQLWNSLSSSLPVFVTGSISV